MGWTDKLTHTCSIVQAGTITDLGHTLADWAHPAATTTLIPCLIQPSVVREMATGAVLASHRMYVAYADVPASLLIHGAERSHRMTAWVHNGLTDAGPFDVIEVRDPGGQAHHVEINLLQVG